MSLIKLWNVIITYKIRCIKDKIMIMVSRPIDIKMIFKERHFVFDGFPLRNLACLGMALTKGKQGKIVLMRNYFLT
jgi:hypothetical protein